MNENYNISVSLRHFDILTTSQLRISNLLPTGQCCNIDYFFGNNIQYYNVGECFTQCIYCGAFGWKLENKGSSNSPDFGHLCCEKNKILLPPFPCLPDGLSAFFEISSIISPKKFFLKNIRKFN